jgi:hypothetical protein
MFIEVNIQDCGWSIFERMMDLFYINFVSANSLTFECIFINSSRCGKDIVL